LRSLSARPLPDADPPLCLVEQFFFWCLFMHMIEQNSLLGAPSRMTLSHWVHAPLLYALRNSAMHVSEQNSFLPVCVGRTYCSGSLPSPHQVHVARLAGLPRCRCVDAGDVVLPGDADVDVEEADADAEEVAFVLAPGAAELLPLLVLLSRPPDMVSRVAVLVVALADSRRQAPWHLRRFRFRVFRSGGQIALRLP